MGGHPEIQPSSAINTLTLYFIMGVDIDLANNNPTKNEPVTRANVVVKGFVADPILNYCQG